MYYTIQNNNLLMADNEQALSRYYSNVKILPSDYNAQKYNIVDNELVLNPDYDKILLDKAKSEKIALNDELRDTALFSGVTYSNVLFDSDTDQKINLLATVGTMSDTDTVVWYGMDNQGLLCNKLDLMAIGGLITELHSFCWQNNAYIKEQIENAETIKELEAIEIDYTRTDT